MTSFDVYFQTLTPRQREILERIRTIVKDTVPTAEEGISYGMPAFLYKKKGFFSAMATKKHMSIYPFSGKVVTEMADKLAAYECTTGSIHFSEDEEFPAALIKEMVRLRLQEIDRK